METLATTAKEFLEAGLSPATKRAYKADWLDFSAFCARHGVAPLPVSPEFLIFYLSQLATEGRKVATIQRRASAIAQAHRLAGFDSPTESEPVRQVLRGIRRTKGTAPVQKAPAKTGTLLRMLATCPDNLLGARDRALLLLGYAGAFRRSELVALDLENLSFTDEGVLVSVIRSKTDQEGRGRTVGIPYGSSPQSCPVRNLKHWLEVSRIETGPLFRAVSRHAQLANARLSEKAVALVIKRAVGKAGLDESKFSGHSLRAGHATQAAANGASDRAIMGQTGHRSRAMVDRYVRGGRVFAENSAMNLGL